jgi:hypothetical protein
MTLIIGKGSIEEKVRREKDARYVMRRQEDIHKGLTKSTGPQRGDFKECREYDKVLSDYRRFKNASDRKKITQEYYGRQKERRA